MAIGDLKGDECVVVKVTAGAAITKGQVVHLELDDGLWDPVVDTDLGKFGVAIEAASGTGIELLVCIWGRVEVAATAAAIAEGSLVMAGTTGKVAIIDATGAGLGEVAGTAMEAFGSGENHTVWIGLGA